MILMGLFQLEVFYDSICYIGYSISPKAQKLFINFFCLEMRIHETQEEQKNQ